MEKKEPVFSAVGGFISKHTNVVCWGDFLLEKNDGFVSTGGCRHDF